MLAVARSIDELRKLESEHPDAVLAQGAFETDAQSAVLESPEMLTRRLRKIPAGRMGDSDEIGPLVCYLASRRSDFATGAVYVIDGGESSRL